jgi:hypothetical protein
MEHECQISHLTEDFICCLWTPLSLIPSKIIHTLFLFCRENLKLLLLLKHIFRSTSPKGQRADELFIKLKSPQSRMDVGITTAMAIISINIGRGSVIKSHTLLTLNEVAF